MSKKNRPNKPAELVKVPEISEAISVEEVVEEASEELAPVEVLEEAAEALEEAALEVVSQDASVEPAIDEELAPEPTVSVEEPTLKSVPEVTEVSGALEDSRFGRMMEIDEAAQILIDGYRPDWLPNLRSFASHNGLPEVCPLPLWEALFRGWGAKFK